MEIEEGQMEHEMDNWEEDSQKYRLKQKEGCEDISSSRSSQETRKCNQEFILIGERNSMGMQ